MKNWTIEFSIPNELKGTIGITGPMGIPGVPGIKFIAYIRQPKIKKILDKI